MTTDLYTQLLKEDIELFNKHMEELLNKELNVAVEKYIKDNYDKNE